MISKKNIFSMMYCQSLILTNKNYSLQTLNLNKSYSTFHKWILDFFKNHPKYNEFVLKKPTLEVNMSDYKYVQLKTIPTDELLNKFSFGCSKPFHYKIDQELLNRINDMSINQILVLMDTCLSEKNKLSTKSVSFKKCLDLMDELWFRRPDLTASQTIQLLYYVSIYKKKAKPTVEFGLQKLMNEINYLKQSSDEELSVLALTTFKSNAKVYDKMLRIFAYRLEKNLSKLIQNPMHFVSLIKPLKKAKYHDQILLTKLTTTFSNNINKASHGVISSVHLLTYLADANYGDVIFLQQLIDSIGNCMIKDNLKNYRIKDVSNYLFSVSYLGLTPKDPNVGKIINDFMNQLFYTKEKCQSQSKLLIGMCLSMWMLDYKPIQLMKFMFSEISIAALRMPNAHKLHNRLDLLLTCASIEQPNLIIQYQLVKNALNVMPESFKHLGERPFLVKVFQTLKKLNLSKVEYNFSIPYLKILGIQIINNTGEVIYIEVLDNSTCLYNTEIPNGMMKLKYRLESKLNYNVITIKESSLNNSTSLESHLKDTMKQEVKNQDLNLKNEIIKIMNKELQCPICNEWLYKATSANCNHTFCEVCIRKWIQINKACPICRTAIQYTTTSIAVDNFISNLCQLFGGSVKEQRESIENARIDDADQTVDERISDLNQSIEEDTFLSQFETTMPPMRHPNMVPLIPLPRVTEVPVFTVNSREPLNLHHSNRGQLSSFIPIVLVDNLRVNDLQPTSNVDLHVSSSINQSIEEDTMISQLETTMPPMRHPNMVPLTPFPRVSEIHVSSSLQSSMELVTSLHNINHLQPTSSMSEVSSCVSSNFDQSVEEDI